MKRIIIFTLISSLLLVSCSNSVKTEDTGTISSESSTPVTATTQSSIDETQNTSAVSNSNETGVTTTESIPGKEVDVNAFKSASDPALLDYVEEDIYAALEDKLASDDCDVINVKAIYVSKEYIEELEYNTKKNIYFGYTASEIEKQFENHPYIFTLGDDGTTEVRLIEAKDDNYDEIVKNVAIGSGIILICVTVAVATYGAASGASAAGTVCAINTFFVAAAKGAASCALIGGAVSGVTAGVIKGYQTGDYQDALSAGALAASQGYMFGAITGAISGGVGSLAKMPKWVKTGGHPDPRQSEIDIAKSLGAKEQVSYLAREEVPWGTPGATRPDGMILNADGTQTAIEVKNYELANKANVENLRRELERQVKQRLVDLPEGTKQAIYLDARGRGYSVQLMEEVKVYLQTSLNKIYQDIPIIYFGG